MNIKEAKNVIEETVRIYMERDAHGDHIIPRSQKRPVMMIGAPGIGKTDIMKQVAADTDMPLLCYTMTHLTRQSLIGLPALRTAVYGGREYSVTENTLSDMMSAILKMQENTGKDEGILFLDEVNCVSETLSATMLDLLQNKRIGNQEIPDGWIIVTAGNPPQYNKSVKEYDVATMDRLRTIYVEPSFSIWKEYAYNVGTHPAVLSFLELNEEFFYKVSSTVDGKRYATARGWSDLSVALYAYERNNLPVDDSLVLQYITEQDIARKFAVYYNLFKKYRMDYSIQDVLKGNAPEEAVTKAKEAAFDERLSIISMLMEGIGTEAKDTMIMDNSLQDVVKRLRTLKKPGNASVHQLLQNHIGEIRDSMEKAKAANALSQYKKAINLTDIDFLTKYHRMLENEGLVRTSNADQFKKVKEVFTKDVKSLERKQKKVSMFLENAFGFLDSAWGDEQEMTLFATEVTCNRSVADFIARYGCDAYYKHNGGLMIYDADKELSNEIGTALDDTAVAV